MQTAVQWYEIVDGARVEVRPVEEPRRDDSGRILGPPIALSNPFRGLKFTARLQPS